MKTANENQGSVKKPLNINRIGIEAPWNWDLKVLDEFGKINADQNTLYPVRQIYVSDRLTLTGGGRGANSLPDRSVSYSESCKRAHDHGIEFLYLLNSPFMDGREFSSEFQTKLRCFVGELIGAGVDSIVVANSAIQHMLKRWYPNLTVGGSVNSKIDSVARAKYFLEAGLIDTLMVDHRNSRNFPLIRALRMNFPLTPIILLVNESCLYDCPWQTLHQASLAASSRIDGCGADSDFYHCLCARCKLLDPTHVLKAPWLRPEDICFAFEAGVTLIKLAGRTESSNWIVECVRAYATGHCDGDVFRFVEKSGLRNPAWEKILRRPVPPCRFEVDNTALANFIRPFLTGSVPCAQHFGCGECRWCEKFMQAVKLPANRTQRLNDIREMLNLCAGESTKLESETQQAAAA